MDIFIHGIDWIDSTLWSYLCLPFLLAAGLFLTFRSRFIQVLQLPAVVTTFLSVLKKQSDEGKGEGGTHPLKLFFAEIGGCIGVGNVITICVAVKMAGPGALFWIWIGGFLGMVVKYSEVSLGIKFRQKNKNGGYDGGPMFFLPKAFPKIRWIGVFAAVLLCVYCTEIFMFRVMVDSIEQNWHIDRVLVVMVMLGFAVYSVKGGVERVGKVCSAIIPVFLVVYISMGLFVLYQHSEQFFFIIQEVFRQAFNLKSAVYGSVSGGFLLMAKEGIERGCYSGDIGIGYASIMHSETNLKDPRRQALLTIFGIFLDTFIICTLSVLIALSTGVWQESIPATVLVQAALAKTFPHMDVFMPFFLLLLGFSTVISFFVVGLKCAHFVSPKNGRKFYYAYAIAAFLLVSIPQVTFATALSVMQISGGCLLLLNIVAMFKLRHHIEFFGLKNKSRD